MYVQDNCRFVASHSKISGNSARLGAGFCTRGLSDAEVLNCTFLSNSADSGGGAIRLLQNSTMSVTDSLFDSKRFLSPIVRAENG